MTGALKDVREKRGGCQSKQRPVRRMSQWSRESQGDLNQAVTLGTVWRKHLPLLWWLMGCGHVERDKSGKREEVVDHRWVELQGRERWGNRGGLSIQFHVI